MRALKTVKLFLIFSSILFLSAAGPSTLTINEIVTSMEKLFADTQEYAGLVDAAFKELRQEDSSELHGIIETINLKTDSIIRRSKAIVKHIEAYQSANLDDKDAAKMQQVGQLLQKTESTFTPAFRQVENLTRLVFKKNIQDILTSISAELEKSYQQNKTYPDQLTKFSDILGKQPFKLTYQKIDAEHYKIEIRPFEEAVVRGIVFEQRFVLTENKTIFIFDLSDQLVETIKLRKI